MRSSVAPCKTHWTLVKWPVGFVWQQLCVSCFTTALLPPKREQRFSPIQLLYAVNKGAHSIFSKNKVWNWGWGYTSLESRTIKRRITTNWSWIQIVSCVFLILHIVFIPNPDKLWNLFPVLRAARGNISGNVWGFYLGVYKPVDATVLSFMLNVGEVCKIW